MIVRELILKTCRLPEVDRFYRTILGLPVLEEDLGRVSFGIGASRLTFERVPECEPAPFYHFAINIPSDQFHAAKKWLADRTPLLNSPDGDDEFHFEAMDADAIYFRDPGHNIGELIAREQIAASGSDEFTVRELLGICEVGLPVRDVGATDEMLRRELGLHIFIPASDSFAAAGDPQGMFVVVREERRWVPTFAPAGIFPMTVILEGPEERSVALDDHPYIIQQRSSSHA